MLAFLSFKDVEIILSDDILSSEIQLLEKNKNLFALEVTQADLGTFLIADIPEEHKKIITMRVVSVKNARKNKEEMTFSRPLFFDTNQSLESVH